MIRLFSANRLQRGELEEFHDLIDSMAFWPAELSQRTRSSRLRTLDGLFDANINAIILKIFENKTVRERILSQWNLSVSGLRPILDHFIVVSYMQMIDISVPAYIVNEFQNLDYSILRSLDNDIIETSTSGIISFGNAIIGEFVLRNHLNNNDIVGAVVRFSNFIDGHNSQRSLQWIIRRILRFRNLSRLLGSATLPNDVFDRASYIPSVRSDPLFWVQYLISQMENDNFLAAERYLATAYAKARQKGDQFDTYQIDTHAARLIVRKISTKGVYDGAAKELLESTSKLRAVIQRRPDDLYHVASVVVLMLKGDTNWSHILNENQYGVYKRDLRTIEAALSTVPAGELLFATEREALDLINKQMA